MYDEVAEPTLLEDLSRECLFQSNEGVASVVVETGDGMSTSAALDVLASMCRLVSITVPIGLVRSLGVLDAALLERPRQACRVWWSLLKVVDTCGFVFQVAYPSRWLHKHLASWLELLGLLSLKPPLCIPSLTGAGTRLRSCACCPLSPPPASASFASCPLGAWGASEGVA